MPKNKKRKEKIDIEWFCEGRVDLSSYDMFLEMAKAGCRMMYFGIESGTQKVLDYYNKKITPEQSRKAVKKARKAGIDLIVGSFILGAPNETRVDVRKTLDFVKGLDIDIPQINILSAVPGNAIWDELKEKGILDEDKYWEKGCWISDIYPYATSLKDLKEIIQDFYHDYLWSPKYVMKQIKLTLKSQYRLNVLFDSLYRINSIMDSISSFVSS